MNETSLQIATDMVLNSFTHFGIDFFEKEPVEVFCEEINRIYMKIDNPDVSDSLIRIAFDIALHSSKEIEVSKTSWSSSRNNERLSILLDNYFKVLSSFSDFMS